MDDRWLIHPKRRGPGRVRLLCFPYAGGGASVFQGWHEQVPDEIEVCAVQLPGRENRIGEPPHDDVTTLLPPLVDALEAVLDAPIAIFGHSMGALIGFELARHLRHEHGVEPLHLFVSGHRAPQLTTPRPAPEEDAELLQELERLDGTPAQVLEHDELRRMVLALMRADLSICRTYDYAAGEPLDCGLSAFGGRDDPEVGSADLEPWRAQTTGSFALRMVPGGHFFIREARGLVLDAVARDLRPHLDGAATRLAAADAGRPVTRGAQP